MSDHYTTKEIRVEYNDGFGFRIIPSPLGPDWLSIASKGDPNAEYDKEGICIPPEMARDLAKALNEMADFCEAQK